MAELHAIRRLPAANRHWWWSPADTRGRVAVTTCTLQPSVRTWQDPAELHAPAPRTDSSHQAGNLFTHTHTRLCYPSGALG